MYVRFIRLIYLVSTLEIHKKRLEKLWVSSTIITNINGTVRIRLDFMNINNEYV